MQLAMEGKHIVDATRAYIHDSAKIINGKYDVVGYAFAGNGKVSSADIYASHDLFERMWMKRLNASAVEALAERARMKDVNPPDAAAVRNVLAEPPGELRSRWGPGCRWSERKRTRPCWSKPVTAIRARGGCTAVTS